MELEQIRPHPGEVIVCVGAGPSPVGLSVLLRRKVRPERRGLSLLATGTTSSWKNRALRSRGGVAEEDEEKKVKLSRFPRYGSKTLQSGSLINGGVPVFFLFSITAQSACVVFRRRLGASALALRQNPPHCRANPHVYILLSAKRLCTAFIRSSEPPTHSHKSPLAPPPARLASPPSLPLAADG